MSQLVNTDNQKRLRFALDVKSLTGIELAYGKRFPCTRPGCERVSEPDDVCIVRLLTSKENKLL